MSVAAGMRGREQHAADGFDFASQPQLTIELARRAAGFACELSGGDENSEGDGQLESATLFGDFRGREIDDDPAGGIVEAAGQHCRLDAVAALPHDRGGQPYQMESR